MAVELTATRASFTGTGVMSAYAAPIYVNDAGQLVVTVDDVPKTLGDDYVLNGLGSASGISVLATFPRGSKVYVERVTPIKQEVDTQNNETILEDVLDLGFDKLTMMMQERAGETARALLVPKGELGLLLAPAGDRANSLPVFDALGGLASLEDTNKVVALTSTGRPYGLPVFDILREIGMDLLDDGAWGGAIAGDDGVWG